MMKFAMPIKCKDGYYCSADIDGRGVFICDLPKELVEKGIVYLGKFGFLKNFYFLGNKNEALNFAEVKTQKGWAIINFEGGFVFEQKDELANFFAYRLSGVWAWINQKGKFVFSEPSVDDETIFEHDGLAKSKNKWKYER